MRKTSIFVAVTMLALAASHAPAAVRPNFVWLVSEDNSKHYLKLYDPHGAATPRIETLAQHGLVFDHAFSNAPVCSVARTTLITGCYAPRIGTQFHRRSVPVPLPSGLKMFPAYLRAAGYYTSNNRKKDYNAIEGDDVWDESSGDATWRNRRPGQPFFHMQSFPASHESSLHFSRDVMRQEKTRTDPAAVVIPSTHPDTPTFRYTYARYLDRIQLIDEMIGRVVDQLAAEQLLADTFVFYFSDHGGVLPGSKGYVYERGLHVPLVVRVPENWRHLVSAARGTRVSAFVSFVDFGPTLLKLAGLDVPDAMDGRPFLGSGIDLAEVDRRDETFGYADRFDEKYDLVRTLRKGNLKYMRNYQPFNFDGLQNNYRYQMLAYAQWRDLFRAGQLNSTQSQFFRRRPPEVLFDLAADPDETRNLAADPDYAQQLVLLRNRLAAFVKGLPDLSFYPESVLVERAFAAPTEFGTSHRDEIAQLVDIADLGLVSFADAEGRIREALNSPDPWRRYWALIACSCHGSSAAPLSDRIRQVAEHDSELLVRVRAAEFLGLIGAQHPQSVFTAALSQTDSGIEAALMLNSVVLLRDGPPGYVLDVTPDTFKPHVLRQPEVQRRLLYLVPPVAP